MLNIGAKIKELRKERKMTLAQVAGDRITKGMLSLIENGKAQPSMESLQHIAKQLDIDVSELMQTENHQQMKELYRDVEIKRLALNKEHDDKKINEKVLELYHLIHPFHENGSLKGATFEEVRIYEVYLTMRYFAKMDLSEKPFVKLVRMYEQVHGYSKILKIFGRMGNIKFLENNYAEGLHYLHEGEKYIEKYGDLIDDLEKLDLYYNITVSYAALNDDVQMEKYLEIALKLAKEKKIVYRLNDFYRFLFFIHCSKEEGEKASYYLKKIRAFAEIMEDPNETLMEQLVTLLYINQIEKDYEKTVATRFDTNFALEGVSYSADIFFNGQYGYAYYMLERYEEALQTLKDIEIVEYNQHPIDLSMMYRAFAVRALCYFKLGDKENAKRDILYAMDGVKDLKVTKEIQFIIDAYEEIKK